MILAAGVTLALLLIPVNDRRSPVELPPEDTLHCIAPSGLHRELVLKYAQDENLPILVELGQACPDSILSGALDLAVLPDTTGLPDGVVSSKPFLKGSVWAIRSNETEALKRINRWMTEISATKAYKKMEKGKLESLEAISRYDDIIKKHAFRIGWDWRLVAAIIYNESRFHNEAESHKGAQGLMQIKSAKYSAEETSDPDRNLEIGTNYLRRLERMYSSSSADATECLKFVLASYNAGEGRIQKCIEKAGLEGLDTSRWAPVSTMLPEGHHTISYVEKVLDTYAEYSILYPR